MSTTTPTDSWIPESARLPPLDVLLALETAPPMVQRQLFPDLPSDDRQARLRRALAACRDFGVVTADQMRRGEA